MQRENSHTWYKRCLRHIVMLGILAMIAALTTTETEGSTLKKDAIDSGGGQANSSDYLLSDSIGQPSPIGEASNGIYWLYAGFWAPAAPPETDGDGVADFADNCPNTANAGQEDTDGDGAGDVCDACPNDPANDSDGDEICGDMDNCPTTPNSNQTDTDTDGSGDACDACPYDSANDSDGDGICGDMDNCPDTPNPDQTDIDGDGIGDLCEMVNSAFKKDVIDSGGGQASSSTYILTDSIGQPSPIGETSNGTYWIYAGFWPPAAPPETDGDGVPDFSDNCPNTSNAGQNDVDSDGFGDACDACPYDPENDADEDGVCGDIDNCPNMSNANQDNMDNDGFGDVCDACPNDPANDSDGDGICGDMDNCPNTPNPDQTDIDGDGIGDACETVNYAFKKYVIDSGGGQASSAGYILTDSIGQPSPIGPLSNSTHQLYAGFWTPAVPNMADLAITKTDSDDPVIAGRKLIYTVDVYNYGPSNASNVTLTDTLNVPDGVTLDINDTNIPTECSFDPDSYELSCPISFLPPGEPALTFTIEVTVGATVPAGTIFNNTVSVSSETNDPNLENNSATEETTVNAAIEVLKTANVTSIPETGGDVTFTMTVNNLLADDPITLDSLNDSTFGDLSEKGCLLPPSIAAKSSYSCSFTAFVGGNAGEIHANMLTASGHDDDGNPVEGSALLELSFEDVLPDISVSKTASPTSIDEPGGNVTFSFTVINNSEETATLHSLVDDLYGDLNGQDNCSLPQTLAGKGGSYSCSITQFISGNAAEIHANGVTATASDDDGNFVKDTDDATVAIGNTSPTVSIVKEGPTNINEGGDSAAYDITITNDSVATDPLTILSLTDDMFDNLLPEAEAVRNGTIVLQPGEFFNFQITRSLMLNAGEEHANVVTVVGADDEGTPANRHDEHNVTALDSLPIIAVEKATSTPTIDEPGGIASYTVTIGNDSVASDPVTIISLNDDRFGDLTTAGTSTCELPQTIQPGEIYSCTFNGDVAGNAGEAHVNTVTASGTDDENNPVSGSDDATVTFSDVQPAIRVTKSADPTEVSDGADVTFTVQVDNDSVSSDPVTLSSLSDDMYGDVIDTENPLISDSTCALRTIQSGERYTCSFTAFVEGSRGESKVDIVTASGADDEGNEVSATGEAAVRVYAGTHLTLQAAPCEYSDPTEIIAVLTTTQGEPVAGKVLNITLHDTVMTAITDENGQVRFTPVISLAEGEYQVRAEFVRDDEHFFWESEAETTLSVSAEQAAIVYSGDYLVQYPNPITLQAQVTDEDDGSSGDLSLCRVHFAVNLIQSDGSELSRGAFYADCDASGVAAITHAFDIGVYSVTASIVDDGYYIPVSASAIIPVYDPNESGHVSGGGWIHVTNPEEGDLGRANFGFIAKYKDGTSTGHLEFQYKDGDIDLKSRQIDWLVISATSAQFQGIGEIKGWEGFYTFRVNCTDNEGKLKPDKFTIKIWPGADTEADPVYKALNQELGGGNIKVRQTTDEVTSESVPLESLAMDIVEIRKSGTGDGTIGVNGQSCGLGCPALFIPYFDSESVTVQVEPAIDSLFVRWEDKDGTQLEGIYYVQAGDVVIAVFEKLE